jgi:primase-polymerase (primpol)-like protein
MKVDKINKKPKYVRYGNCIWYNTPCFKQFEPLYILVNPQQAETELKKLNKEEENQNE